MSALEILTYPDERLRTVASPVTEFSEEIKTIVSDMFRTMDETNTGIGLAATQVNIHKRIIVTNVDNTPRLFINPVIVDEADQLVRFGEGCLSVPGYTETVERCSHISVESLDADGNTQFIEATGMLAICLQHEIDHLDGKLFIDRISEKRRMIIDKKISKHQK